MRLKHRKRAASSNFSPGASEVSPALGAPSAMSTGNDLRSMPAMAPLAFTCGDPAGIGPEIISAWLASHRDEAKDVAVIGPTRWLDLLPGDSKKIAVGLEDFAAIPGHPDGDGALVAWAAMERAAQGCACGEFAAV